MTCRVARVTQCEIERALCAAEKRRARGGEAWRVRIETDGTIVLEVQPHPPPDDGWPRGEAGPGFGERRRIVM